MGRQTRIERITKIIFCEGSKDSVFLKHLKNIFQENRRVKIESQKGGDVSSYIKKISFEDKISSLLQKEILQKMRKKILELDILIKIFTD